MTSVRLYIYGAILLAFLGLATFAGCEHKANKRLQIERDQATANYAALQAAQAHERKIASEASHDYEKRIADLEDRKSDTPVRSVRLCRSPTGYVSAPTPAPAGTGPGSESGHTSEARRDLEAGPDIGNDLYALADEKDLMLAQCASLIKWVGSR